MGKELVAHVFISYRRQEPDSTLALDLAERLRQADHSVFLDQEIAPGDNWSVRIAAELKRASDLVLLLSREAAESDMVAEEIRLARLHGARLIPVRVAFPDGEALPYHVGAMLGTIQQATWSTEADTATLADELASAISGEMDSCDVGAADSLRPYCANGPLPQCDLGVPGGAVAPTAEHYIHRRADARAIRDLEAGRCFVTVRGPRQYGKTSLMKRVVQHGRDRLGLACAFVDFQSFERQRDFRSISAIWCAIADAVARALPHGHADEPVRWDDGARWRPNLDRLFDSLTGFESRILVCLDEVDRMFDTAADLRNDFFGALRSLYNDGSDDATWKRVNWIQGSSTEPAFFLDDLSQSPFNISDPIVLSAFTHDETSQLCAHHNLDDTTGEAERLTQLLGGQPYLTHLAVHRLSHGDIGRDELYDVPTAARTVFRDHVRRFELHFQEDRALARAMDDVVHGRGVSDARLKSRLEAAGLIREDSEFRATPACDLYASVFQARR